MGFLGFDVVRRDDGKARDGAATIALPNVIHAGERKRLSLRLEVISRECPIIFDRATFSRGNQLL